MYKIELTKTSEVLDTFETMAEALWVVMLHEMEDTQNGNYIFGFYAIRDTKTGEVKPVDYDYNVLNDDGSAFEIIHNTPAKHFSNIIEGE